MAGLNQGCVYQYALSLMLISKLKVWEEEWPRVEPLPEVWVRLKASEYCATIPQVSVMTIIWGSYDVKDMLYDVVVVGITFNDCQGDVVVALGMLRPSSALRSKSGGATCFGPYMGQLWASSNCPFAPLFSSISIVRLELLLDAPSPLWATLFSPLWTQFPNPSWTQFASSLHGLLQLPVHRGLASDFEFHSTSPCSFPLPTQQALDSEINEIHRRMPQEEGHEEPPYGRTQWPVLIFDVNVMRR